MGKINKQEYKQSSDLLSPDDIEETAILTITEFADGSREDGKGKWALLKFEETGDKIMWLTDVAIDTLVLRYGDETDEWVGAKVCVEQYDSKRSGKKVRIMAEEEWDQLLKEMGVKVAARPATRTATSRSSARSSGKR